ncbi:MAG: hypothetical protein K5637_01795 [Lachnospiraceae bacterium]|nr:hypothetical protein [Lachnospiraceae bacterium]
MTYADINKRFTETVMEYIGKGYYFNVASMSGHQGEDGKVDLTNGEEIIRVMVGDFTDNKSLFTGWLEGKELLVGRCTDKVAPNSSSTWGTIWTDHLEVISSEKFYSVSERNHRQEAWYGSLEEAKAAHDMRMSRYISLDERRNLKSRPLGEKAGQIVLDYIRSQKGCKRAKASDIKVVRRDSVSFDGKARKIGYDAIYKGTAYRIA